MAGREERGGGVGGEQGGGSETCALLPPPDADPKMKDYLKKKKRQEYTARLQPGSREARAEGSQVELLPDTLLCAHTHFPSPPRGCCARSPRADAQGCSESPELGAALGKLCLRRG